MKFLKGSPCVDLWSFYLTYVRYDNPTLSLKVIFSLIATQTFEFRKFTERYCKKIV